MSLKIKDGVVFIIPCYSCPRYEKCLESDEDVVLNHLIFKATVVIFAEHLGLKIATNEEEWLKETERLIGLRVYGFSYNVGVDYNNQGVEQIIPQLDICGGDGMAVIVGEVDGRIILLNHVGRVNLDKIFAEPMAEVVRLKRVELMETDPKNWSEILEDGIEQLTN